MKLLTILGVVVPLASIAAVNLAVDPYATFGLVHGSWNECKPETLERARLMKAYAVRQRRPDHLVLGTSRAQIGISADYAGWPPGETYNLSFPNASMLEIEAYLRHAHAIHPTKTALLGLDFFIFNENHVTSDHFDPKILAANDRFLGWIQEDLRLAFSAVSATASYRTIEANLDDELICPLMPTGWRNPAHAAQFDSMHDKVHARIFMTASAFITRRYSRDTNPVTTFENVQSRMAFESYRNILRFCHENGIDLRLYISPIHASLSQTIASLGLWDAWELWKRELVRLNEEASVQGDGPPFPLTDFSGYNEYTSEAIPSPATDDEMLYYIECSHFNHLLGNIVLSVVLEGADVPGFGRRLDGATVEAELAAIRLEREKWESDHAELVAQILNLTVSTLKRADFDAAHGFNDE